MPLRIAASDAVADSVAAVDSSEQFRWTKLIAPVAMTGVGYWGVSNGWIRGINRDVRDGMADLRGDNYIHADEWLQYVPTGVYAGLGFIPGVNHKNDFKCRLAAGVTANLVMAVLVEGTKYIVDEQRPNGGDHRSFPSGHTATAFVGAELMRLEYGNWVGLGGYAVATGVAFLRMYNNRHWLNDVVAGAGIGILSANIGYWLLPLEKRWFGWDNSSQAVAVVPSYVPGGMAMNVAVTF